MLSLFLIPCPLFPLEASYCPGSVLSANSDPVLDLFIQSELIPALAELRDGISQTRAFHPEKKAVIITLGETISCDSATDSISAAEQHTAINPLKE